MKGIWSPNRRNNPGATRSEIAKWQRMNGVKLPAILVEALRLQDGGTIRYSNIAVNPLAKIGRPNEAILKFAWQGERAFPADTTVFEFARELSGEPLYLLIFRRRDGSDEPTVHSVYGDGGEVCREAKTVKEFFDRLTEVFAQPAFDWSEVELLERVLHRETTEIRFAGGRITVESVLGRRGKNLFLYWHEVSGNEVIYRRTVLPEPLSPDETTIETIPRPRSTPIFSMKLASKRAVTERRECRRMHDGMWKCELCYELDEVRSASKDTLSALRRSLFGRKASSKPIRSQMDDLMELLNRATGALKRKSTRKASIS